ncbi:MAG: EAL domain-containing protein [Sphaerospermopsis kisseleviana]
MSQHFHRLIEDSLHGLIVLYRQPILKLGVDSTEDKISHYEILSRFSYQGELQSPANWVKSFEEHDLCYLLDRHVIKLLSEYLKKTGDTTVYSVNVSGQTINQNGLFVDHVVSCNLPSTTIFECTESVVIELCHLMDSACSLIAIESLRHLSKEFTLAIDDFGIGAFRLAHLDSIKPKFVKIDGSFARAMENSETAQSDIAAISQIAHARGCEVCLEWVETKAQLELARKIGIDYVQGFAVAKPELLTVL